MPTIRIPQVSTAPAVEPGSLPTGGADLEGQAIRQGAAAIGQAINDFVVQPVARQEAEERREQDERDRLRAKTDLQAFDLLLKDSMTQAGRQIEALDPTTVDRQAIIEEKLGESFDSIREEFLSRPGITDKAREVLEVSGGNLREMARQGLDAVYENRVEEYREGVARQAVEDIVADAILAESIDGLLERLPGSLDGTRLAGTPAGDRLLESAARQAVAGILVQDTPGSRALAERLVMGTDVEPIQRALGAGYSEAVQVARTTERTRAEARLTAMQDDQATAADLAARPWAANELWDEAIAVQEEANSPYSQRLFGPSHDVYRARVDQVVLKLQSVAESFNLGQKILQGEVFSDGSPQMMEAVSRAYQASGGVEITPDSVITLVRRAGGMIPQLGAQIAQGWNSDSPEVALNAAQAVRRVLEDNDQLINIPSAKADSVAWLKSKFSDEQLSRMVLATDLVDLGIDPATALNSARSQGAVDRDGSAWAKLADENEKWLTSKASAWFSTDINLTASFREDWNKVARAFHQGGLLNDEQAREAAWHQVLNVSHYNDGGTLIKGDPRLKGQWAHDELVNDALSVGYTREEVGKVTFIQQTVRGKDVYVGRFETPDGQVRILQRDPEDPESGPLYLEVDPRKLNLTARESVLGAQAAIGAVRAERDGYAAWQEIVQRDEQFRELYAAGKVDWPFFSTSKSLPGDELYQAMSGGARYNSIQSELRDLQSALSIPRGARNRSERVKSAYLGMHRELTGEIERAEKTKRLLIGMERYDAARAIDMALREFKRLEESLGDSRD